MPTISLVVRGKVAEDHNPSWFVQHSDVVLSTGAPIGFFPLQGGPFIKRLSKRGEVFNFESYKNVRPEYVDVEVAKARNSISTICKIEVSDIQAQKFDQYWNDLKLDVSTGKERYKLLGDNCSSRASEAFVAAGILSKEIPGLDTPNALYQQLKNKYPGSFACKSGYVGFKKINNKYQVDFVKP